MPKFQRKNIPWQLLDHLADRVRSREITRQDVEQLARWIDSDPELPAGEWFKRFQNFTLCGRGDLPATLLTRSMSATGTEVE
ncbi:hypothetical protein OH491_17415 [Termitidicoccus mucosus]|uniref:Uncharacterized protein n=1 Tax=Termitidicoccus mucosus TaxID=1184151 RepID=A0A178IKU4_9BACT|nr:hypothetical protein AW736_11180 [Opitutaceae bacterium TSB47]